MRLRRIVITGGAALALAAGGTAAGAAIASGPVDGNGVIHGCWTNAAINGTHVFVMQDAGTNCPKGTTAISWNQSGNTVLNGTGAPASTVGNDGDFYIDTAADVLYGPKANGSWPATGTSLVGAPGAAGPAGPAGPQGPPGASGGLDTMIGTPCDTADSAHVGTLQVTYTPKPDGTDSVSIVCDQNNPMFTVTVNWNSNVLVNVNPPPLPPLLPVPATVTDSPGTMNCLATTTSLPTCSDTFAKGTSVTVTVSNSNNVPASFFGNQGTDTCPTGTKEVTQGVAACTFTVTGDVTLTAF